MKKTIATLLMLIGVAVPALAQDAAPEEELPEIRRYTVEVIIFSYTEDVSVGTEQFPPDEIPAADEFDELSVTPATRKFDLIAYAEDPKWLEFTLLTEEEYTLTHVIDQFERLDVYETVMHFGWTQPTFPQEGTEALELNVFGEPPEGLDGSLTLYLSRYLHLVVDLALEVPGDPAGEFEIDQPIRVYGDSRTSFFDDPVVEEPPAYYRIQENRIVRNGDIRYFDHPKFGVVAKVTRVEKEEPAEAETLQPAPLVGLSGQ